MRGHFRPTPSDCEEKRRHTHRREKACTHRHVTNAQPQTRMRQQTCVSPEPRHNRNFNFSAKSKHAILIQSLQVSSETFLTYWVCCSCVMVRLGARTAQLIQNCPSSFYQAPKLRVAWFSAVHSCTFYAPFCLALQLLHSASLWPMFVCPLVFQRVGV